MEMEIPMCSKSMKISDFNGYFALLYRSTVLVMGLSFNYIYVSMICFFIFKQNFVCNSSNL